MCMYVCVYKDIYLLSQNHIFLNHISLKRLLPYQLLTHWVGYYTLNTGRFGY